MVSLRGEEDEEDEEVEDEDDSVVEVLMGSVGGSTAPVDSIQQLAAREERIGRGAAGCVKQKERKDGDFSATKWIFGSDCRDSQIS